MQRRDFVRNALFGTGAACSLALPSAYAALKRNATPPLRTALARLEHADSARWIPIEHCASAACGVPEALRVQITALGFPRHFGALSIDAMFATDAGLRPFRIAHYQPGAISPASKPFSFNVTSASLAGFRVEHADADSAAIAVAGSALLGGQHSALASGDYLLLAAAADAPMDFSALPTQAGHAPVGEDTAVAWLRFSVHPNHAG